jgi:drug/metabolite transporter (DMT)-like permease
VFTAVLAWLLLGEGLQGYHWLGAALIFTGLLLGTQGWAKLRQATR